MWLDLASILPATRKLLCRLAQERAGAKEGEPVPDLITVRVVNINRLLKEGLWQEGQPLPAIYCGRPMPGGLVARSPLGNPFRVPKKATDAQRRECLGKYLDWLCAHPEQDRLLRELAARVKASEHRTLACWCGDFPENPDLICHAVELAKRVQAILDKEVSGGE